MHRPAVEVALQVGRHVGRRLIAQRPDRAPSPSARWPAAAPAPAARSRLGSRGWPRADRVDAARRRWRRRTAAGRTAARRESRRARRRRCGRRSAATDRAAPARRTAACPCRWPRCGWSELRPKSRMRGTSCASTMMFDGLRSRCCRPSAWACWMAWQISTSTRARWRELERRADAAELEAVDVLHDDRPADRPPGGPRRCARSADPRRAPSTAPRAGIPPRPPARADRAA